MDDPSAFPPAIRPFALAHTAGLRRLREAGEDTAVDWVMLTPGGGLEQDAPRTGRRMAGRRAGAGGGARAVVRGSGRGGARRDRDADPAPDARVGVRSAWCAEGVRETGETRPAKGNTSRMSRTAALATPPTHRGPLVVQPLRKRHCAECRMGTVAVGGRRGWGAAVSGLRGSRASGVPAARGHGVDAQGAGGEWAVGGGGAVRTAAGPVRAAGRSRRGGGARACRGTVPRGRGGAAAAPGAGRGAAGRGGRAVRGGVRGGDTTAVPRLPRGAGRAVAAHASARGSGRVGRSAAGRALSEGAVFSAVAASIRHVDTPYDQLLMSGVPRHEARRRISVGVEGVLQGWREGGVPAEAAAGVEMDAG